MKDSDIQNMINNMRLAIVYLPAIDIPTYFAYATNLIKKDDILNANKHIYEVTSDINVNAYEKEKERMNKKFGKGHYIHEFIVYYERQLQKYNGSTEYTILPAITAPLSMPIFWAKHILKMSKCYIDKVQSLTKLAYCSPVQLQGDMEGHFRLYTTHVYVYSVISIKLLFIYNLIYNLDICQRIVKKINIKIQYIEQHLLHILIEEI